MKNTFKLLSCVTAGVAFMLAGQLRAGAVGNNFVPVPFSPMIISGSGVGSLASTNGSGVVTYSAKNFALNDAFILAEFYASDYAVSNGLTAAVGDSLAVVNVNQTFVSEVVVGYRKLNSGQKIPIYGLSTNSLVAPYGRNVYWGDVVILNIRGQVKTDLTQIGVNPWFPDSFEGNDGSVSVGDAYLEQGHGTMEFDLTFGGMPETLQFDLFGGATFSSVNNWYGTLSLNGGGTGFMSNPADHALLNGAIVFTKVTATVPYQSRD